ncbi:MAG: polysaccharide deacetylase family protein [Gammaproteobacteria bacterium]|nr:polysaccharide deacetylase family protein [Gammaproteobacteria bacterium]MBU1723558.1 polysaccharide deacetylase family protein [Gammaproteobacteria bacterium]MBU2004116.1 polysaccharide deacetylase family protein [Gammaproteobacteria bacterium]
MRSFIYRLACILGLLLLWPGSMQAATNQPGVVLSFDDAFVDQWHTFFAGRTDVRATFFVSHWHTLSAAQIEKLRSLEAAGHEIGCHSYDHAGVGNLDYNFDPNKADLYVAEQVIPAIANMNVSGFSPVSFAYPSGERDANYDAAIRPYLPYLRSTFADENNQLAQMDDIYHDSDKNYGFLSGDGMDTLYQNELPEIEAALTRAKNNGEIITLYAHRILPDGGEGHNYGMYAAKLNAVIDKAKQLGLQFYTFAEAYQVGNQGGGGGSSGQIITALYGNRVHLTWSDMPTHDFVGVSFAGQTAWLYGGDTNGAVAGKIGVTVSEPVAGQQYVAHFYLNGSVVSTSAPFSFDGVPTVAAPTSLVASSPSDGTVNLNWGDASNNETGFRVERCLGTACSDFVEVGSTAADVASFAETGLSAGTYRYRVQAYNASAASAYSGVAEVMVTDNGGGGGGSGQIITALYGNRVHLTWSDMPAHNFVGVSLAGQTAWLYGGETNGAVSGKIGVTVSEPVAGQQYEAHFYLNGSVVATSAPFTFL